MNNVLFSWQPVYEQPMDRTKNNNVYERESFIRPQSASIDSSSNNKTIFKDNNVQLGVPPSLQRSRNQTKLKVRAVFLLILVLFVTVIVLSVLYCKSVFSKKEKSSGVSDDQSKKQFFIFYQIFKMNGFFQRNNFNVLLSDFPEELAFPEFFTYNPSIDIFK